MPRVTCPDHGIQSVSVPWSEPHSRFTLVFSWFAIRVLQATKVQSQAAALLRLNAGQVHALMHSAVQRGLARRAALPLPYLGLDEKGFARGHSYLSVLSDTGRGRVCVREWRKVAPARRPSSCCNRSEKSSNWMVESVSMDMWKPFLASREAVLPHTDTIHDRFHIASYLGEAVDKTRRGEHRSLSRVNRTSVDRTSVNRTSVNRTSVNRTSILSKTKGSTDNLVEDAPNGLL